MNKIFSLLFLVSALVVGCATVDGPTTPTAPALNVQSMPPTAVINASPLPPPSKCQSKLTGSISDASGALVKGATIELKGAGTEKLPSAISDDSGKYGFAGLCAGTYTFVVTVTDQPAKTLDTQAIADGTQMVKVDLVVK